MQQGRVGARQGRLGGCFKVGAKFDLATFDLAADQFAQGRLLSPQFIGQAKAQVEVAAVDRADLHPQAQAHLLGRVCTKL